MPFQPSSCSSIWISYECIEIRCLQNAACFTAHKAVLCLLCTRPSSSHGPLDH